MPESTWETDKTLGQLDNDEGLYNEARALAASQLSLSSCASVLKENFEDMMPSLGVAETSEIDWEEVAQAFYTEED